MLMVPYKDVPVFLRTVMENWGIGCATAPGVTVGEAMCHYLGLMLDDSDCASLNERGDLFISFTHPLKDEDARVLSALGSYAHGSVVVLDEHNNLHRYKIENGLFLSHVEPTDVHFDAWERECRQEVIIK